MRDLRTRRSTQIEKEEAIVGKHNFKRGGTPRLDLSILARAAQEVSVGVHDATETEVQQLVRSCFNSLTDAEVLEVHARVKNIVMQIFRGESFKRSVEEQCEEVIGGIARAAIDKLTPSIEAGVHKHLHEEFDKVVVAITQKALDEALDAVRAKIIMKMALMKEDG